MGKIWSNNLIDTKTGEKLYTYEKRGVERLNEKGYLFKSNANKATTYECIDLPEELEDSDIGKIFRLRKHIERYSNMLRIRKSKGYFPMEKKDFANVWDISERQTRTLLNKFKDLGIIAEATIETAKEISTQFYMNPLYLHNGNRINFTLYRIFEKQLKPYLPPWVIIEFEKGLEENG
jgi:hypothetical protein